MPRRSHPIVIAIRAGLAAAADPARAKGAQAYMKSEMPFRGVSAPILRRLCRDVFVAHPLTTSAAWQRAVLELWRTASFREERYAAVELTSQKRYLSYRTPDILPMLEEMIVTGAWWDYVDAVATGPLGALLPDVADTLRAWSVDADMWKRRAAILCQIRRKADTDLTLLYDCIEPNLADREFFIRKAIGWALRSYAWTDPREVKRYVRAHRARLSGLSAREATKNIS